MAKLFLIPCTLGGKLENSIPNGNKAVILATKHFIVENIRTARRFLKQVERTIDIDSLTFYELNQHTDRTRISEYLSPIAQGENVGIISEAGCPAVADPGSDVVAIAQGKGIDVVPLVGPSSILLSLMASGFNGQSFTFNGYLPIDGKERASKLKQLEGRIHSEQQTQIFIETPYRNVQMVEYLCKTLQPNTKLCIAVDISCEEEWIKTKTIKEWGKTKLPEIHKRPCIFLIYK